jgi:hypothetical protein
MRKTALYSRSSTHADTSPPVAALALPASRWQRLARSPRWQQPRTLWLAMAVISLLWLITLSLALRPGQRALTQKDIDAAVLHTL